MPSDPVFIYADWPAPENVTALTTTRIGGLSRGGYAWFNLADHVGDDLEAVQKNRLLLRETLELPEEPVWLNQVHGVRVIDASTSSDRTADGSYSNQAGVVCAVLSADCLPVFLCDRRGAQVALVHAGWRGLAAGVIEQTVAAFRTPASELLVWLGPAIGPLAFEVGDEVRQRFVSHDPYSAVAFTANNRNRWYADIYALARRRLQNLGVDKIYGGNFCTVREHEKFFSYRRNPICGRMASLIWLEN
ncbi:MAG TPA: peptidoglycan editing factor PgeF [Acidiferrobacterales bacterium]|nr:peptidoglycan editing factor PgeF [Acidiferrobacterales bacterium]